MENPPLCSCYVHPVTGSPSTRKRPCDVHDASRDACPKCGGVLAAHSIRFGPDDKENKHGLMYVDCPIKSAEKANN